MDFEQKEKKQAYLEYLNTEKKEQSKKGGAFWVLWIIGIVGLRGLMIFTHEMGMGDNGLFVTVPIIAFLIFMAIRKIVNEKKSKVKA